MNLSIAWDNPEQTVIRQTLLDGWTWEALYELNQQTNAMMRSVDHTVHLMVDFTQTSHLPVGGLTHAHNIFKNYPPNFGILVVVTHNLLVERMISMFQAVYSRKVYGVGSFDDAYRLLLSDKLSAT